MKMINKKVLTTTIAASVVLSGGFIGLLQTDAFADTPTATTQPTDQAGKGQPGSDRRMGGMDKRKEVGPFNLLKESATILGTDEKTLNEKLKAGQSLSEIALASGLAEDVFLQKLTDAVTKTVDEALAAGKLTQDQADKAKAGIAERLKNGIAAKGQAKDRGPGGPGGKGGPGHSGDRGFGPGGMGPGMGFGPRFLGNEDTLVGILGVTKEELKAALNAGKSLAEIAQEKGISEDDLIAKLKDAMTDGLKKFVEGKRDPGQQGHSPKLQPKPQQREGGNKSSQQPKLRHQQKGSPAPSSSPAGQA